MPGGWDPIAQELIIDVRRPSDGHQWMATTRAHPELHAMGDTIYYAMKKLRQKIARKEKQQRKYTTDATF